MKRPPMPHLRPRSTSRPEPHRRHHALRRLLPVTVAMLLVSTVSAWLALLVTPSQTVSTAGQTIGVGTAEPTFALSGPGNSICSGRICPPCCSSTA